MTTNERCTQANKRLEATLNRSVAQHKLAVKRGFARARGQFLSGDPMQKYWQWRNNETIGNIFSQFNEVLGRNQFAVNFGAREYPEGAVINIRKPPRYNYRQSNA